MKSTPWPVLALLLAPALAAAADRPLALHPDNPHYFLFRGKPTVLLTSGEHYGAVLNRDFDYVRYLDTLQKAGFNLTRTFSGMYREVPGSFNIVENTLAPRADRYVCPWPHSKAPGAGDGGTKFDLHAFDPAYFRRLKDFVAQAGKRGIVVELTLFCTVYDDKLWAVNPLRAGNNVQGIGKGARLDLYTLRERELTAVQEALIRKIAGELKDCDNVYYEICNEPYFGGVTAAWNDHMAAVLREAEKDFPARHLIAQNINNFKQKVERPCPDVSIFNFHYATPPDTVGLNFGLKCPIADDETGFKGTADRHYRREGWEFFMAGGAVYSNLDYSFSCSHPDGTLKVTTSPGGGGPALRRQLRVLKDVMDSLDLVHVRPDDRVIRSIKAARDKETPVGRALVDPGKTYVVYLHGGSRAELTLELPRGAYQVEWINTRTGKRDGSDAVVHKGGAYTCTSPAYEEDIALRVCIRTNR
jgi:hypothetical protein